jgi:rhamnose transport system permease protein
VEEQGYRPGELPPGGRPAVPPGGRPVEEQGYRPGEEGQSQAQPGGPYGGPARARPPLWQFAARWEAGLVVVLIAALVFGSSESATFTTSTTLFYAGINTGYIALMALPMTLIVITAEIDLSVASALGMSGSLLGDLWHHGWPLWGALAAALAAGVAGGALNGALVSRGGLPSIAVTIGTLTLFRGIAEILLGSQTIPGIGDRAFPQWFTRIGVVPVPGTQLSYTTVIFAALAVACGVALHATPLGRSLYAIGLQPEAARFAGLRVARIKFWLYVFSGLVCSLAGILLVAQNSSVSYNAGYGLELNVVAVVLLGGVSIFGGRGTVIGVALAAAIIASLQMALTQMTVDPNVQEIVIGGLLLISVVIPSLGRLRPYLRRPRRAAWPAQSTRSNAPDT